MNQESFDEAAWWAGALNTFHEEQKQLVYAERMGLRANWGVAHPPAYDLEGKSVIDLGGGPVSLLLKGLNRGRSVVVDPIEWPSWVLQRYELAGIEFWRSRAEDISGYSFDEAWIYNVLQHVDDPKKVISVARELAQIVRIFEWIDLEPYEGHPHRLEKPLLDEWLGSPGFTATINENGAVGHAFYGVFSSL